VTGGGDARLLADWGWEPWFADQLEPSGPASPAGALPAGAVPARVLVGHKGYYDLVGAAGHLSAVPVTAALRRGAASTADFPAVGDWVLVGGGDEPAIEARLRRRTDIVRRAPGRVPEAQVLAANVDTAFIVTSATDDLSVRRVERQLAVVVGGGVEPVVVVTKSDLVEDPEAAGRVLAVATRGRVAVVPVSNATGDGLDELRRWLLPRSTVALLGSSGVGKSSLVNRLAGAELLATDDVRDDGRGRHTTVRRELVRLGSGALVVDTPGVREVQLWDEAGLAEVFDEIGALAADCHFADCGHDLEPGCAVGAAAAQGRVSGERVRAYRTLVAELDTTRHQLEDRRRPRPSRVSPGSRG